MRLEPDEQLLTKQFLNHYKTKWWWGWNNFVNCIITTKRIRLEILFPPVKLLEMGKEQFAGYELKPHILRPTIFLKYRTYGREKEVMLITSAKRREALVDALEKFRG